MLYSCNNPPHECAELFLPKLFKLLFCNDLLRHFVFNGCVYETFGISKYFPVKLKLLLLQAGMFDNALAAKCFIFDVNTSNLYQ